MSKHVVTLKSGSKVTHDRRKRHGSSRHLYGFLLAFHSNYGPISHRFRDRRRFQSKIATFLTPVYALFYASADGVTFGIWYLQGKTRMWGYQTVE